MKFKESIAAVKKSLNEAIKETGLTVQSISFQDHWKSSLSLSVPKELEELGALLDRSLENEGITLRSLSFSWTMNRGWNIDGTNAQVSIQIEPRAPEDSAIFPSELPGN